MKVLLSIASNIRTKSCKRKASRDKITEGAAVVISRFRENHQKQEKQHRLAHQHGKVFEKFKENAKFTETVKQLGVSKSNIIVSENIAKLI